VSDKLDRHGQDSDNLRWYSSKYSLYPERVYPEMHDVMIMYIYDNPFWSNASRILFHV